MKMMTMNNVTPIVVIFVGLVLTAGIVFTLCILESLIHSKFIELKNRRLIKKELQEKIGFLYDTMLVSAMTMLDQSTTDEENDDME